MVDIAPQHDPARHSEILAALGSVEQAGVRSRREAERLLAEHVKSPRERAFLQKSLVQADDGIYRWKMNVKLIRNSYEELLSWPYQDGGTGPCYEGPVLFVAGGRSNYLSSDDLPRIRTQFPRATLETVGEAGHWVHADDPEGFLSHFRPFVSGDHE